MTSTLGYDPFTEDMYDITIRDGRKSVCDRKCRATF